VDSRLADAMSKAVITFAPVSHTVHTIVEAAGAAVSNDAMPPGDASKLRGQIGWSASNSFGRCGRLATLALKDRHYESVCHMTDRLREALTFAAVMAKNLPPRAVGISRSSPRKLVIGYSDAEYKPGSGIPPRLGWAFFHPDLSLPIARTCLLDDSTVDSWKPRSQQIFPAETFAVLAALVTHAALLKGCDILWFVDNEAACSTLIRGASREEDVHLIAEITHWTAMKMDVRIWIEWIDSSSNPSDGLSREGLLCPRFGHLASEVHEPDWAELSSSFRTLEGLADIGESPSQAP